MIKFNTLLFSFGLLVTLATGDLNNTIKQLAGSEASERAQAALTISQSDEALSYDTYQRLMDLLDDSERAVLDLGEAGKKNTTASLEARKALIARGEAAVQALAVGLVERRPSIRWRLCEILAYTGSQESIEALLNVIRVDPEKLVRNSASKALANIGDAALPSLIESIHTGEIHVRQQAIWVLSEMRDPTTIPLLLRMATDAKSPLAGNAIEALYKFDELAIGPCLNILQNSQDMVARERTAYLLGRFDLPQSTAGLAYIFLTEQNDRLRMICLQALHKHNEPKLCDLLLNAITDPNPRIVAMAKPMLKKYPYFAAKSMVAYIQNLNPQITEVAFDGLQSLGSKATPVYVHLAKSEHLPMAIRKQAASRAREHSFKDVSLEDRVKCLFVIQDWAGLAVFGTRFRDFYIEGAYSNDPNERFGSTIMLGELANYQNLEVLIDKLSDPSPNVREAAFYGLTKIGRTIQKDLVEQLNKRSDSSVQKIATLLTQFKFNPKNDIERILLYSAHKQWNEMDVLGERALSYLIEQLESPNKQTTLWAADTLAQWHTHSDLTKFDLEAIHPMLYDLLDVRNTFKREKAFDLLALQANHEAVTSLLVPLLIPEPEYTEIAAKKMGEMGVVPLEMLATALLSDLKETYAPALATLELIDEPAIPMLISGLKNPKFKTQILAILDRMHYKPTTPQEEVDFLLAAESYESLVRMGNLGIAALAAICNSPENSEKEAIYTALRHSQRPEVTQLLIQAVIRGTPSEKKAAEESLLALDQAAIPELRKLATQGNFMQAILASQILNKMEYEPTNREEALWIGAVQQNPKVLVDHEAEVLKLLAGNILSDYENLRQVATGTMALMREQKQSALKDHTYKLADNIIENLEHENAEIRAESARLISRHGQKAYHLIPNLVTLAKDNTTLLINGKQTSTQWGVLTPSWFACQALILMAPHSVEPLMDTYITATEPEQQLLAMALCNISDPRLVAIQRELVHDPRAVIQQAAIANLAKAKDLESIPALIELADLKNATAFNIILQALEQIGTDATPYIIETYDAAASSGERYTLATLLTRCTTPKAYQRIESFIEEASANQAKAIYNQLRHVDDQKSITLLVSGLKNSSWSVRQGIADSLVAKGESVLPILIPALDVPDENTRGYLRQILRILTKKDFGKNNTAWQAWWKEQQNLEQES